MRYREFAMAALIGLGAASCGENAPPASDAGASAGKLSAPAPRPQLPAPPGGAAPVAPAATAAPAAKQDEVVPPADARWTILCYQIDGPTHVADANDVKAALVKKTGRRDWYVIHGKDASNLYFGFYRAIDTRGIGERKDPAEVNRAHADLAMIGNIEWGSEGKVFRTSAFVQLNAPDPIGHPEWNLANVDREKDAKDPARKFWTLQIAAFRDNPKRKEAAVQAVEALREHGVEAYYFHGDAISSVCVGSWPASAVKQQQSDGGAAAPLAYADQIPVVTPEPLPENLVPKRLNGKEVVAIAPKLEITDPSMRDMIARYPDHEINYKTRSHKTKSGKVVNDPSFLVSIPRPTGNGLFDNGGDAPDALPGGLAADPRSSATIHTGLLGGDPRDNPGASRRVGSLGMQPTPPAPR